MGAGVRLRFMRQDIRQIGRLENEGGTAPDDDVIRSFVSCPVCQSHRVRGGLGRSSAAASETGDEKYNIV